jgi:uncharacterized protein (TIGR00369 family)
MEIHTNSSGGFDHLIGVDIEEAGPDRCVVSLEIDDRHHQPYGIVHGGIYCTLVESAASIGGAVHAMEQGIPGAVGVSNTTDFFRSHRTGRIRAVATPIHQGRSQQVWVVEITRDDDGALLARGQVRLHNLTDPATIGESPKPESNQ